MQFDKSINNEQMIREMKMALGHKSSASLIQVNQGHGSGPRGEHLRASEMSDLSEVAMGTKSIEEP